MIWTLWRRPPYSFYLRLTSDIGFCSYTVGGGQDPCTVSPSVLSNTRQIIRLSQRRECLRRYPSSKCQSCWQILHTTGSGAPQPVLFITAWIVPVTQWTACNSPAAETSPMHTRKRSETRSADSDFLFLFFLTRQEDRSYAGMDEHINNPWNETKKVKSLSSKAHINVSSHLRDSYSVIKNMLRLMTTITLITNSQSSVWLPCCAGALSKATNPPPC